jgi:uncharacterized membrane protein YqjE
MTDELQPGRATGLLQSLRSLLATLLALAQTRMELLTTELQEEVQRMAGMLMWGLTALLTGILGLLLAGLTVVVLYWDSHRVLAALAVTAFFVCASATAGGVLWLKLRRRPPFLHATLSELGKDAQAVEPRP